MSYRSRPIVPVLAALVVAASAALFSSSLLSSQAVQNPTLSLDMMTTGTNYTPSQDADGNFLPDPGTNVMNVGTVEDCLVTAAPGNNLQHSHNVHIVIQNVEDLIGWQLRVNYFGDKMRPNTVSAAPFNDSFYGQNVSFVNLPVDQATFLHRDVIVATNIPPAAPGPQTAIMGSVYQGPQNFAISPDTPAKAVPDDNTYSAPTGGVVATLNLQVLAGNAGQTLSMDADDANPNAPGSAVVIFDGTGQQTIDLAESALGDGFHDEGSGSCAPSPTPPPTPPPVAGHDARLFRLGGVPKNVRLSPGEVINDSASIVVANDGDHTETIGIYADVMAPAASGGCTPNGRVLETTVTLDAGKKTTISVPVSYSCADPSAADGLSYTWTAVADHGGDDLASCAPGSLQGLTCFNALADDDEDPADNRKSRTGPKVVAQ